MAVRRIFVEKRQGFFDVEAQQLADDLTETFRLTGLKAVRIIQRYDIEGLSDADYGRVRDIVFFEPPVDVLYEGRLPDFAGSSMFAVEYLPGQYDQRADSAAQCVQLVTQGERPVIRTARVIVLVGSVDEVSFKKIKDYCINAVECREASMEVPTTLAMQTEEPPLVEMLMDFNGLSMEALETLRRERGFAMSLEDLAFCQKHFRETAQRPPTITELRVIDTYWSDHCRHTTFTTAIDMVDIEDGHFSRALSMAYQL